MNKGVPRVKIIDIVNKWENVVCVVIGSGWPGQQQYGSAVLWSNSPPPSQQTQGLHCLHQPGWFLQVQYQSPSTSLVPDLCVLSGITTTIESGYTAQICDFVFYSVNGRNPQCSLNHPVLSSRIFVCQFGTWVRTSSYIMRPLSVCPCSELLMKKRLDYFGQWVYPLSHELILQSIRAPLVSGFYKLLAVSMEVAKRIKYFQVNRVHQFHPITMLWKDVWYNLRCMH